MTNAEIFNLVCVLIFIVFLPGILGGLALSGWSPFNKSIEKYEKRQEELRDLYRNKNIEFIESLGKCTGLIRKTMKGVCLYDRIGLYAYASSSGCPSRHPFLVWSTNRFTDEFKFSLLNTGNEETLCIKITLLIESDPYDSSKQAFHYEPLLCSIVMSARDNYSSYIEIFNMAVEWLKQFQCDQSEDGLNYLLYCISNYRDDWYTLWSTNSKPTYISKPGTNSHGA